MIDDDAHREFLLNTLRAASLRCKLMDTELTTIGIALKNDLIGPDMAVKWLHDQNLMFLIDVLPPDVGATALLDVGSTDAKAE